MYVRALSNECVKFNIFSVRYCQVCIKENLNKKTTKRKYGRNLAEPA